jgi:hypothetical protein
MSEVYSIFIKKKALIAEIKSLLEQTMNCSLEKDVTVDWDLYKTQLLGLEVSLFEAVDYEDDGELSLSRFSYEVTIEFTKKLFTMAYKDEWIKVFSLVLANFLCDYLNSECLVVRNSQILIKKFLPRQSEPANKR